MGGANWRLWGQCWGEFEGYQVDGEDHCLSTDGYGCTKKHETMTISEDCTYLYIGEYEQCTATSARLRHVDYEETASGSPGWRILTQKSCNASNKISDDPTCQARSLQRADGVVDLQRLTNCRFAKAVTRKILSACSNAGRVTEGRFLSRFSAASRVQAAGLFSSVFQSQLFPLPTHHHCLHPLSPLGLAALSKGSRCPALYS